ncbi:MAG: radical SAM protein [Alicyclobacillaceae bacterium]|nr:radical SAM protein [Alicyclobacillaceae bacterium]
MKVNELFFSIQGESSSMGLPTVFVRFTGCNLRCSYCDTTYAYFEGKRMTPEEVFARIEAYGVRRVCLTGGEPLIQPRDELQKLLNLLGSDQYEVSIETDGSVDIDRIRLRPRQRFILDVKVPSSQMHLYMDFDNLRRIVPERDEVKFVVGTEEDYEWSKEIIDRYDIRPEKGYSLLFSPVFGVLEPRKLAEWILRDRLNARLQVQLHKFIWDPATRGV